MKKITILVVLLFFIYGTGFATRYLVQNGTAGSSSWRAASDGEILVDLGVVSQSFNTWYDATVLTGDEVWIAAGKYVLSAVCNIDQAGHTVYGGFVGTETAISERAKVEEGNPWDYVNETILDGNGLSQIIKSANTFLDVLFDGVTMTNSVSANAAAQYRDGVTVKNCKVINNTSTGNGGGVNFYNGGNLIDSYVAGNVGAAGGGVYSNNASAVNSYVSGCLIENNRASGTNGGGAVRVQGTGAGFTIVSNSILRGNKSSDGTTYRHGGAIYTNSVNNKFINCLIYNNEGSNAIYFNGGSLIHVTLVNNIGQLYVAGATNAMNIINSVVWSNKTDASGDVNTGVTSNTGNKSVVIENTAVYPPLAADAYTQANNIALELASDSVPNPLQPGFAMPASFYGAPVTDEQKLELPGVDLNLTPHSALLDMAKVIEGGEADINELTRPQGPAGDIGALELPYYTLTVTFNEGGTVDSLTSGAVLSKPKGKELSFTITPNSNKMVSSVDYNSESVLLSLVEGVLNLAPLTGNSILSVEFADDLSTGVKNIHAVDYFTTANSLELRNQVIGSELSIYHINGQMMLNTIISASELSIPMQNGMYILKIADQQFKLIVR